MAGAIPRYVDPASIYPVRVSFHAGGSASCGVTYDSGTGLLTLVLAGHEVTATGSSYALLSIAGTGWTAYSEYWLAATYVNSVTFRVQGPTGAATPTVTALTFIPGDAVKGCAITPSTATKRRVLLTYTRRFVGSGGTKANAAPRAKTAATTLPALTENTSNTTTYDVTHAGFTTTNHKFELMLGGIR